MCETKFINFFSLCYPLIKYPNNNQFYNYTFKKVPKWALNENVRLSNLHLQTLCKLDCYQNDAEVHNAATQALNIYRQLYNDNCIEIPNLRLIEELHLLKEYKNE